MAAKLDITAAQGLAEEQLETDCGFLRMSFERERASHNRIYTATWVLTLFLCSESIDSLLFSDDGVFAKPSFPPALSIQLIVVLSEMFNHHRLVGSSELLVQNPSCPWNVSLGTVGRGK